MNFKTVFTVAAITLLSGASNAAVNIVNNPGFEVPNIGMPVDGYMYTNSVPGWVVTGNPTVLFNSTYRPVFTGLQAVQIERNGDMLSQSLTTVNGQQYQLSFNWSTWWLNNTTVSTLEVTSGNVINTLMATGTAYSPQSWLFTAAGASTTLSFMNIGATGTSYPQIDNVSVTAVPEPGTYAMLLAGLAAVGFVAKRRSA